MGIISNLLGSSEKKERFKQMQEERRMERLLEQREKPSNERELERFYEEERQVMIKQKLEEFRKKKQDEFMHGNSILEQKNIFKGHKSILAQDKSVLDNGKGILNDKKLFTIGKGLQAKGGMFFK